MPFVITRSETFTQRAGLVEAVNFGKDELIPVVLLAPSSTCCQILLLDLYTYVVCIDSFG
jgi:hypothetical protein